MKKLIVIVTLALVATACSKKPEPDPVIALCPARTVQILQKNQLVLDGVEAGKSPASAIKNLRGVVRKATLEKGGDSMGVVFFQTGLPKCPWLQGQEAVTPVVVRDGVVMAKGSQMLTDLTHGGWVITEAAWPWQRYGFGYLPSK